MTTINREELLLAIALVLGGVVAHVPYLWSAKHRWRARNFDLVVAIGFRLTPDSSWPFKERVLHTGLWFIKQLGLICIVVGAALLLYTLFGLGRTA